MLNLCLSFSANSCFFLVLGTIRSAVGSAQLLISQKFEQFRGLCNENLVSFGWSTIWSYFHLFLLNTFMVQINICWRFGGLQFFWSSSSFTFSLQNINANPRPTAQDLAGFWDLLQLSIEDISLKFDDLYHLKANNWQLSEKPQKKVKFVRKFKFNVFWIWESTL